ncbi:2-oxoacid:acceptor oxidoreductase family protein [Desulfovermiculus halophilus]|uniref:2-oxoacid:acceptor oxidoreductase family protein n=1 Tax=Desulfovermiculus halophilus TaxID=339722 RepID=UPI0004827108|nr:2-oxoacid:acceptor oxidoreductase family protein [Desulfovermiculus halophilus]
MYQDVIIAGFGGQGVLLIGNVLAQAAMQAGRNVTFMPVYGVEMRGGTANCTVVVSDQEIGSPVIHSPMSVIAMNQPSLVKFQPRLRSGGILVVNSSLVEAEILDQEGGQTIVPVPANELANELGSIKMANIVALGAWVQATVALPMQSVRDVVASMFASKGEKLIQANDAALLRGAEWAQSRARAGQPV